MPRPSPLISTAAIPLAVAALALTATGADGSAARAPALSVRVAHSGLDYPWDATFITATKYLVTERPGRLWLGDLSGSGSLRPVKATLGDVHVDREAGLMGIVADPAFSSNRTFYTCQTHVSPNDVRVVRWRLSADGSSATRVGAPVISGIPLSYFHIGCRVLFGADRKLYVSTGDAGLGPAPQAKANLGGKILRVNSNGTIPADNPYAKWAGKARYVWNWGHRNPQGLALRPGTTQLYSAEHGPDRDDEVNRVVKAGNYGWNPVFPGGAPGYNQSVPMTDTVKYPKAIRAIWASGKPTVATSGIEFVKGGAWGGYNGALFVAKLKDTGVMSLRLNSSGAVTAVAEVPELDGTYGRLRTVRRAPDGTLLVLTGNGGAADQILLVRPS